MVKSCSVFGCTHRANSVATEKGVRFFKFPKGSHKRRSWIKAMNRRDWVPNENSFVCSAHFVSGWHSYDAGDADYAPSVFIYKETAVEEKRQDRAFRRDLSKTFEASAKAHKKRENSMLHMSTAMHTYCGDGKNDVDEVVQTGPMEYHDDISSLSQKIKCDTLIEENQQLREENERLRKELKMMKWGVSYCWWRTIWNYCQRRPEALVLRKGSNIQNNIH
ncbi:THAP9-like protein, partial [Mya arenaria]